MIIKEWRSMGSQWRLLRDQYRTWYYLEQDGKIVAEGTREELLSKGWFN